MKNAQQRVQVDAVEVSQFLGGVVHRLERQAALARAVALAEELDEDALRLAAEGLNHGLLGLVADLERADRAFSQGSGACVLHGRFEELPSVSRGDVAVGGNVA